jgi:hypothetical protein
MKKQLICILISAAALQVVSAEKWEPKTHECSLAFPDGSWTFQPGKEIDHGQVLLSATQQQRIKAVNLVRYQVALSISVQDPRFVKGLQNGFTKSGFRMLNNGYTNINGCVAYWFTGEAIAKGNEIYTLRYALCESGRLYQLIADSVDGSPMNDSELLGILTSFQIHTQALPYTSIHDDNSLAYRIGQITGYLLVTVLVGGVVVRQFWKAAQEQDRASEAR